MANATWLAATSADWITPGAWSGGSAPVDPTADASLLVAGSYSVGIAAGETISPGNVTVTAAGVTLAVAGALIMAGVLDLQAGVLQLGGNFIGGTLRMAGGVLAANGGTLDGVAVLGTLAPSRFQSVSVIHGLSVQPLAGGGPGSIDLTTGGLNLLDNTTLDQIVISLGGAFGALSEAAGGTLTLGPSTLLNVAGGVLADAGGAKFVNQGQIAIIADPAGFGFSISPTLLNSGGISIAAGNGNRVALGAGLVNSGSIGIGVNATLRVGNLGATFANTGTIQLDAGATLELDQNLTISDLLAGTIDNQGGQFTLGGTLTLGNATLEVAESGMFSNLAVTGTVRGGTLLGSGGVLALPGATLDGVVLAGTFDLSNAGAGYTVTVKNGLATAAATSIDAHSDTLSFLGSATLDDLDIAFGQTVANYGQLHYPASTLQALAGSTLTLGPSTVLRVDGSASIDVPSLVNHGSLLVSAGASLILGSSILVNAATVGIAAGASVTVLNLVNAGSIDLQTGGTLQLAASATLPQLITTLGSIGVGDGKLLLSGSIDLLGGTIDVGATGLFSNLVLAGIVKNGTIRESGGTLTLGVGASQFGVAQVNGPTLDNVLFKGLLDLGGPTRGAAIRNGFTLQSATGALPGALNLGGGQLTVLDAETLDAITISIGAPVPSSNPVAYSIWDGGGAGSLTLGPATMVTATGAATIGLTGFTNLGVYDAGGTQKQWVGSKIVNAGLVTLADGGLLIAGSTLAANSGSIVASGKSGLNISGAALSNSGLLQATGGTFTVGSGLTNFAGTTLNGGTYEADAGATLDLLRNANLVIDAAAIVLNGIGSVIATFQASSGTFRPIELTLRSIAAGHSLSVLGSRDYATSGSIADSGVLQLGGGVFTASTIAIAAGGQLRGFGRIAAEIVNTGTIVAQGGLLTLAGLGGGGVLRVDPGATLELSAASNIALSFNLVGGSLLLDAPQSFSGSLSNFAPGDTLLLKDAAATGASVAGGNLNVTLAAGGTLHYALLNPQANIGATVSLGLGGLTEVVLTPPSAACFLQGTRMLTMQGERPIESLRIGDEIVTMLGRRRATVCWIGSWRASCDNHARPWDVRPVRVQAGAFGAGLPHRDLFLSPDHAVYTGGVLIPIRYLLNGASVTQLPIDHVTYWHVELDRHDVLLAEGLPAESFLDTGNRGVFRGESGATALHPDFSRGTWKAAGCAPLVTDGPLLLEARRALLAGAAVLGHSVTGEPGLRLSTDQGPISPAIDGAIAHFALPPGCRMARLQSRVTVPAEMNPASSDRRRLGVAVTDLRLDGRTPSPGIRGGGWYAAELQWQWTDGNAELDLTGAASLDVTLVGLPRYWCVPTGSPTDETGRAAAAWLSAELSGRRPQALAQPSP